MLKDVQKRRLEGWRFRYGVDGYEFVPAEKTEAILNNYMKRFPTDQDALDWVKERAAQGSVYHQRAIEYLIAAQMSPANVIKNRDMFT